MTIHKTSERLPTEADALKGRDYEAYDDHEGTDYYWVMAWGMGEWDKVDITYIRPNEPRGYTHWFDPKEGPVEPSFSRGD